MSTAIEEAPVVAPEKGLSVDRDALKGAKRAPGGGSGKKLRVPGARLDKQPAYLMPTRGWVVDWYDLHTGAGQASTAIVTSVNGRSVNVTVFKDGCAPKPVHNVYRKGDEAFDKQKGFRKMGCWDWATGHEEARLYDPNVQEAVQAAAKAAAKKKPTE